MRLVLLCLLLAVGLSACGVPSDGLDAYSDGRFDDAQTAFAKAIENAGDDASQELLYDHALATIRANEQRPVDLRVAQESADAAHALADESFAGTAAFLQGNVAFARCELAQAQALAPEAEPFAFQLALKIGESARERWAAAAASRPDWPAARRNVERALAKLDEIRRQRDEAAKNRDPKKQNDAQPDAQPGAPPDAGPDSQPPPPPPTPQGTEDTPQDAPSGVTGTELTAEQVRGLLEKLVQKEQEKLSVRRAERGRRSRDVEKDW